MLDLFLWIIICVSYICATIGSFAIFLPSIPNSKPDPIFYALFVFGWIIGTLCLKAQVKRDLHAVSLFTTIAGLLIAFMCGAVVLNGDKPHPIAAIIATLGAVLMIVSMVYIGWCEYSKDKIPNVLLQLFKRHGIWETEGVQFVEYHTGKHVSAGESFDVIFFLQNCWNAERKVLISIKANQNKSLIFPQETEIVLSSGAVMKVSIPIYTMPDAKGKYSLTIGLRVNRGTGSRLRRWHAPSYSPPVSLPMLLVESLSGMPVASGGGIKIEGKISPSSKPNQPTFSNQASPARIEMIWTDYAGYFRNIDDIIRELYER